MMLKRVSVFPVWLLQDHEKLRRTMYVDADLTYYRGLGGLDNGCDSN